MNILANNKPLLLLISGIIICESIAQSCIKSSLANNNIYIIIIAVILYSIICILLFKCYSHKSMGIINIIWSVGSIISVTLFGVVLFHEKLTKYDIIGITLCIIGIYFIFIPDHIDL